MKIKDNLSLIFGISIPILMVIFVALSIYLPQMFVKPQYDFLYLIGNNSCYTGGNNIQIYSVQNGKVVKNVQDVAAQACITGRMMDLKIFFYDIKANQSKEVTFNDIENLNLDSSAQSPDGFEVVHGNNDGGVFPFYFYSGSDYDSRYIKGHSVSKKLNIQQEGSYYYNFIFLGWVKK